MDPEFDGIFSLEINNLWKLKLRRLEVIKTVYIESKQIIVNREPNNKIVFLLHKIL